MLKYKLTTQKITTHNGHQWVAGEWQRIAKPGDRMCSDEVFHYYDHPLVAVLMNPIHANIPNPLLWEVEIDSPVAHDVFKGGCKGMALRKRVELPVLTIQQRVEVSIRLALVECVEPNFIKWAKNWFDGYDRSVMETSASWATEGKAREAVMAALTAAEAGADAEAARARAEAVASWATEAEAEAARAWADEARAASWAEEAAAEAAEATARAAAAAADEAAARAEYWSANTLIPTLEMVYNRDSTMKESK